MSRALITAIASLLVVANVAGTGQARVAPKQSVEEAPYATPVLGAHVDEAGSGAYYYDCLHGIGCAILTVGPRDRFARLEIVDSAGHPVFGRVYVMPGGEQIGEFCGSTDRAWSTWGAKELLVHVIAGTCSGGGGPSIPTSGVIRATFSTRP